MPLLVHRAVVAAHRRAPRHSVCPALVLPVEDLRAVLQLDQTMALRSPVAAVVARAATALPEPQHVAAMAGLAGRVRSLELLRHMVAVEAAANEPQEAPVRVSTVADLAGLTRRA